MCKKLTTLFFCLSIISGTSFAQEIWSLEKSINHALQNSLDIKQSQLNVSQAELTEKGNRLERLPSLNASASYGYQFGRTIDPTSNVFRNISFGSNSISLNAGVTLFNGNRINNSIKQANLDAAAGRADLEDTERTVAINLATAHLNILFAEEQLLNTRKRMEQTENQLDQTDKLIRAGTLPQADRLTVLAQLATDEQAVITAENNVQIAYLTLKNLLLLPPDLDMRIERPDIAIPDASPELLTFENVYNQSIGFQPSIRANDLRMQSALLEEDIARSGMLPSLSLFAAIRTDYNNKVLDLNEPNLDNFQLIPGDEEPVLIDGDNKTIQFFEATGIEFPKRGYFDQLNDNFGQSVGISLNIPIYNNHRTQIAMERARLNVINTEIANELTKQSLKANVAEALAVAKAAKKQLEAAQKTVEALQVAYENNDKRFKLGAINVFEFTTSKNQLDQAIVDLTIARFDYLFKLKVVDFYQGKPITLD